jgi:hypothetical protein
MGRRLSDRYRCFYCRAAMVGKIDAAPHPDRPAQRSALACGLFVAPATAADIKVMISGGFSPACRELSVQKVTVFSAGVASNAKEPAAARSLIEYLSSPQAYATVKKTGRESAAKDQK